MSVRTAIGRIAAEAHKWASADLQDDPNPAVHQGWNSIGSRVIVQLSGHASHVHFGDQRSGSACLPPISRQWFIAMLRQVTWHSWQASMQAFIIGSIWWFIIHPSRVSPPAPSKVRGPAGFPSPRPIFIDLNTVSDPICIWVKGTMP